MKRWYGHKVLDTFWSYENNIFKYKKGFKDIAFLSKCKTFDTIPNFLNFKMSNISYNNLPSAKRLNVHYLNKK